MREVRVVGAGGEQLGILPLQQALRYAEEADLDLVEVAPQSRPPVCRLMDYGRFRYDQSKKDRETRKRQKSAVVKEVRMSPKTDRHDFDVKARNTERFLREGDRVKVSIRFRGREIVHADLAKNRLLTMAKTLSETGALERPPYLEGRHMSMLLAPRKSPARDREVGRARSASQSSTEEVIIHAES